MLKHYNIDITQYMYIHHTTLLPAAENPTLTLKIVSSKKKSEYVIQNLRLSTRFSTLTSLKEQVMSKCDGKVSFDEGFGYIEPGRGVKGKQRWLLSDEDVADMYTLHNGKKEILLWCYSAQESSKRPHPPDEPDEGSYSQKRSRYKKQIDMMREVEEIEDDLRSKHEGKYTEEQIRMWAHLIQMNKHTSYEEPPNKKLWKTSDNAGSSQGASGSKSHSLGSSKSVLDSPGKRVSLRGQCIDQLHRLQQLYTDGGITNDQYMEMKESIMKEVKKFE